MENLGIIDVQIFITSGVYLSRCIRLPDRQYSGLDIPFSGLLSLKCRKEHASKIRTKTVHQ
jgi:hypothetical protein